MTNPLEGVDDLITQILLSPHAAKRKELREVVRQKVAQANLVINECNRAHGSETVARIPKARLTRLVAAEDKLAALEDAGVDNWDGYSIAMESLREKE